MFSRAYRTAITLPPLVWVLVFLLIPYALLFCFSFWSVSPAQSIVHSVADVQTTLNAYAHVTEDAEMRSVAEWKAFTAGWRIGAHGHEQIGSGL